MLKNRLIGCLTVKNNIVVQSIGFNKYLPVGKPAIAIEFLNLWGIDEIILLDLDATRENREPNYDLIKNISRKCFVPLTVGGGINNLEQIKKLIRNGADKVSINTSAIKNLNLIKQASEVFGNQCIIVSIDVAKDKEGNYKVFMNTTKTITNIDPIKLVKKAEEYGAGEIFLNSVNNDGLKTGYDLNLIKNISESVSIPIIACGGAGHPQHFFEAITIGKASATAAGNFFHFTEHSPIIVKQFLKQKKSNIRLDTYANYNNFLFDDKGRIDRPSSNYLQSIRFRFFSEEVI
jgi:imidazole glycerol-phosphate synthase subunit HisF